ncbi:cytochrome P450 81Q32-like [Malania oleifera]|uniref:cytochrome P450 81Q32-like n=1 Tax=Malania oleifera TaxID=397392 RepID=UPI0025AEBB84|nr:cytochrome P450 81Q32-like [Malania oleifera]
MAEIELLHVTFLLSFFLFVYKFVNLPRQRKPKNLPPGPRALPVIGHLHLLRDPVFRALDEVSQQYGPVLFLQLGNRKVLVVSSLSIAQECFTKNDIVFASRPHLLAGEHLQYNSTTVPLATYGDHWRSLRRLITVEILSAYRVAMFSGIREEEVMLLTKQLWESSPGAGWTKVDVKTKLTELAFNGILATITGKRYFGRDVADIEEAREFQRIFKEYTVLHGNSMLGDYLPIMRWFDFKGVEKGMKRAMKKMDAFFVSLIEEQRRVRSKSGASSNDDAAGGHGMKKKRTLIDEMLQLQEVEPELYTDQIIKGIVLTMLTAATETSSTSMEWAMGLLLNHPEAIQKAKAEIETHVGLDRVVEEQDLPKLAYLQNIINETIRLYPALPLALPHEASADCTVAGYDVPRGTMLLTNLWAIHRDPKLWDRPRDFVPERFEGKEGERRVNVMIPFSAGRRICPGASLARKVMGLTLAVFIQCFDWKRVGPEKVDLTEGSGITMPMARPLEAMYKPRAATEKLLHV